MSRLVFSLLRKARAGDPPGAHWITIHPARYTHTREGEPTKGRRVLIDGEGRIVGGELPKTAQGQHIHDWWKQSRPVEPLLHRHLQERRVAYQHHASGHLTTGAGYRETENRWGKPEAMPNHVRVRTSRKHPHYLVLDSAYSDKDRLKTLGAKFGPQLDSATVKKWYIPIDRLPDLLQQFPHSEVDPAAVLAYEAHHRGADHPTVAALAQQFAGNETASPSARATTQAAIHDTAAQWWTPVREALTSVPPEERSAGIDHPLAAPTQAVFPSQGRADQGPPPGTAVITRQGIGIAGRSRKQSNEDGIWGPSDIRWVILTEVRPPRSEAEWQTLQTAALERIARERQTYAERQRQMQLHALGRQIQDHGTRPQGSDGQLLPWPDGTEVPINPWTAYGGGASLILDAAHRRIWYIQNNGADGDNWSMNNIRTGGAGAIGWVVPWDNAMATQIRQWSAPTVQKSSRLIFPLTKGFLTTAYGEGRAPAKTPDAGKRWHQTARIDATTTEESVPTVRLNGFTPNVAWALLRRAGYRLAITDGRAMLPGQTTITVRENVITLQGRKAAAYAQWFQRQLRDMVDWAGQVDGKQDVSSIRSHGGQL